MSIVCPCCGGGIGQSDGASVLLKDMGLSTRARHGVQDTLDREHGEARAWSAADVAAMDRERFLYARNFGLTSANEVFHVLERLGILASAHPSWRRAR